jgi:hypothetical protein
MDVSDASYYIQENNENKGSRMGHTKKILKKSNNKETQFKDFNYLAPNMLVCQALERTL